ncbi:PRTRC system protein A [Pseudoduganella lutea]|uniref:PRTRC system protein A n=1 Tax=Pseudoduganella lutea TaxID=321985 RepID=A0A4V0Z4B5_9BURK|nr:PRTRC system protein A [Pseudoduganella lutea]QBE66363.1 PRTRC system protein A [Pseudoduganella lutea]
MADPRDAVLLAACPVIAAPRHGALPSMSPGLRLVVAANGVFVQVRLPWLDCLQRFGGIDSGLPVPYGALSPWLRLSFGVIPADLLRRFIASARYAAPDETAAAIIHDGRSGMLRVATCETVEADRDHVVYRLPLLAATEQVVLDLHSHGDAPAFFSALGDADDRAIKLCGVFGRVRSRHPEARVRLAINGLFIDLCDQWDSVVGLTRLGCEP